MEIDEIETFVAIAELGGFTRAARRLHRSQPAISRRLGILEHELGAPMFERMRGRARLTEAGRNFLPHAEAALRRSGTGARRCAACKRHGGRDLARAGRHACRHAYRRRAAPVRGASKNVRLELRTASSREVTDLVRRGEAMLGLRYFTSDRPELVSLDAGSEKMLVVAAPGPSAGRPPDTPSAAIGRRAMDRLSANAWRTGTPRATRHDS